MSQGFPTPLSASMIHWKDSQDSEELLYSWLRYIIVRGYGSKWANGKGTWTKLIGVISQWSCTDVVNSPWIFVRQTWVKQTGKFPWACCSGFLSEVSPYACRASLIDSSYSDVSIQSKIAFIMNHTVRNQLCNETGTNWPNAEGTAHTSTLYLAEYSKVSELLF